MFVVVGLGNPGPKYSDTRHNAGAWVLARLWETLPADTARAHGCLIGRARRDRQDLILIRPLTFMNGSGLPVSRVRKDMFPDLPPERILVIHDDLDVPVGRIRVRSSGGSGGHRGIDSLIFHLQSEDFGRLRVGIDRPPEGMDTADYVLLPPTRSQEQAMGPAVEAASGAVLHIMEHGYESAMNLYNGREWGP